MVRIDPSEITPEHVYLNRRHFIKGMGGLALSIALSGCVTDSPQPTSTVEPLPTFTRESEAPMAGTLMDELGDSLTPFDTVAGYNNYYEFSLSKTDVVKQVGDFVSSPWELRVNGLVNKPKTYNLDDLLNFDQEERVYRMRCVEAWSMVIPWLGFPLNRLLEEVEPTAEAKYVRFETAFLPEQMPGLKNPSVPWPYVEGLRLDEAMHDLTILSTGLYGKSLLAQNGAPVRLVVPWKYGFKSIKSIVKIDLVEEMPVSTWMELAPQEYGFYANVNPDVPHPRWSQATERRIGQSGRRKTLIFNGYEEEVASLYEGMGLEIFY